MKKVLVIILLTILLIIVLSYCTKSDVIKYSEMTNSLPKEMPSDFSFVFRYGINSTQYRTIIDTNENMLAKDLFQDGVTRTDYKMPINNLRKIYKDLREVNILAYPTKYKPPYTDNPKKGERYYSSYMTYRLTLYYNNDKFEFSWNDVNCSASINARKLKKVFNNIRKIVEDTKEYKSLPASSNGYD